jgi:mRNA interferase HigB
MARVALFAWYHELVISEFKSFNDLKKVYGNVSLVSDDRVVFNIMGNKYRLVVRMVFEFKAIQIKWFGTHSEYDKIDVIFIEILYGSINSELLKNNILQLSL